MTTPPKPGSPLLVRLPGYHLLAGLAVLLLAGWAKQSLPQEIGSSPIIQYPCNFLTAILFPLGSFLALRALLVQAGHRRKLMVQHIVGLAVVIGLLAIYFYGFMVLTRTLALTHQAPSALPKLAENAKSLSTETGRARQAKYAYRLYGVVVAYPLDDNSITYYKPTDDDQAAWHEQEAIDRKIKGIRAFLERTTNQFPYLFALYAGTLLATYLIGSLILLWELCPRQVTTPT